MSQERVKLYAAYKGYGCAWQIQEVDAERLAKSFKTAISWQAHNYRTHHGLGDVDTTFGAAKERALERLRKQAQRAMESFNQAQRDIEAVQALTTSTPVVRV